MTFGYDNSRDHLHLYLSNFHACRILPLSIELTIFRQDLLDDEMRLLFVCLLLCFYHVYRRTFSEANSLDAGYPVESNRAALNISFDSMVSQKTWSNPRRIVHRCHTMTDLTMLTDLRLFDHILVVGPNGHRP